LNPTEPSDFEKLLQHFQDVQERHTSFRRKALSLAKRS